MLDFAFRIAARRNRSAFVRLGLIAVFLLALLSCNSNPGPPAAVTVTSVTDLGPIPTNPDILGRDGAFSALFQGYSVWVYGDTFLASPNADGRGLISDTWSFTTDLTAQDGISGFQERLDSAGAPSMVLEETPAEYAFNQAHNGDPCQVAPCGARWALWPSTVVIDPSSCNALVLYGIVYALPGAFNFSGLGSS